MKIAARLILCVALFGQSHSMAQRISEEDCELLRGYGARDGFPEFTEQFLHLTHTREICTNDAGDLMFDCPTPLVKWIEPFDIIPFDGTKKDRPHLGEVLYYNALGMSLLLKKFTGLEVEVSTQPAFERTLKIYWVDPENAHLLSDHVFFKQLFDHAMSNDESGCTATAIVGDDYRIRRAEVYINANVSERMLARCVKEEILNTVGLSNDPVGLASFFDDEYSRPSIDQPPLHELTSIFEAQVLYFLYNPRLQIGGPREETKEVVTQLIKEACG